MPSTTVMQDPWMQQYFLKDAKLRVRERYWRSPPQRIVLHRRVVCIPDAVSWRKYCPVLKNLAMETKESIQWILLESVADFMDYRNRSPVKELGGLSETAAPQERTILTRLAQRSGLCIFSDLSVRMEEDEWEWLDYSEMSVADRSRQAMLRAASLVVQQEDKLLGVWLVVSDEASLAQLKSIQLDTGVQILGVESLIQRLGTEKILDLDRVSNLREHAKACQESYRQRNSFHLQNRNNVGDGVDDDLSPELIQAGVRAKQFLRGKLQVSRENSKEAFVSIGDQVFFIDAQRGHFRRAFHEDVVIIQVLIETEWGRPVGKHRLVVHRDDDDDGESSVGLSGPPMPSARVVAIDKPYRRSFVTTMIDRPKDSDSYILVVPMDVRIPKIRVNARSWQSYVGKRLTVEVDGWERGSNYPHGRCTSILGSIGDLETELSALLRENQVDLEPFSAAALACLPLQGDNWTIPETEPYNRRDLRSSRLVFSVDPPGCQDIDDSMHVHILNDGDVEIGVHIADVTYFVEHESALDREARIRATTFYLVDRRFDMLPTTLSSNLCSLHGGMDRLAVSVIWTFSSDLQDVISCWFGRTVIHNSAAMTYDQADNILNGKPPDPPNMTPPPPLTAGTPVNSTLVPSLKMSLIALRRLAVLLRERRETLGGAVDLSSKDIGSELKFTLANGVPVKVVPKADKEIHEVVAELMILANTHVAAKMFAGFPESALLRVHRSVEDERFAEIREVFEAAGMVFDGSSNKALAESLKRSKTSGMSSVASALLQSLATRAMSEAQYVCSGDDEKAGGFSHYGLGLDIYTHFTSPIRRYADVVVHKQLLATMHNEGCERRSQSLPLHVNAEVSSLPHSNVISILDGEGLDNDSQDASSLDELIEGATQSVLGPAAAEALDGVKLPIPLAPADGSRSERPFLADDVRVICDGLNLHNRLAKYSSGECQRLFLSLYFRSHSESTEAVVTSLSSNGLWCYVPRFDFRLPVYLTNSAGQLLLDPDVLGLPSSSGLLVSSDTRRLFPSGACRLIGDGDDRLDLSTPEASSRVTIRPLDVLLVQLTCDDWDVRARVPVPSVRLLAKTTQQGSVNISSITVQSATNYPRRQDDAGTEQRLCKSENVYTVISSLDRSAVVEAEDVNPIASHSRREVSLGGRIVFGSFVNPDTRLAAQEAARLNAADEAAQRRSQNAASAAKRNEFDSSARIERQATSRQQRLAADKRNTRKSKAK